MEALAKQDVTLAKRPQKASLRSVKRLLWSAIIRVSQVVEHSEDEATVIKAGHALATLAGSYARLDEAQTTAPANALIARRVTESFDR